MSEKYTRILHLSNVTVEQATPILKAAAQQGCPGLQLLPEDGGLKISITAHDDTKEETNKADVWAKALAQKFGDKCSLNAPVQEHDPLGKGDDSTAQFAAHISANIESQPEQKTEPKTSEAATAANYSDVVAAARLLYDLPEGQEKITYEEEEEEEKKGGILLPVLILVVALAALAAIGWKLGLFSSLLVALK